MFFLNGLFSNENGTFKTVDLASKYKKKSLYEKFCHGNNYHLPRVHVEHLSVDANLQQSGKQIKPIGSNRIELNE